jgi:ABC-type nitrate/sulfonate/bicarbonate transport system permease component
MASSLSVKNPRHRSKSAGDGYTRSRKIGAQRLRLVAVELIVPAALIAAWWLISARSSSVYFPPLSQIFTAMRKYWLFAHFGSDALPTLEHLGAGLLIAATIGVAGGLVLGLTPIVADAVAPILEFLRAIPGVALLPAALLLLGIGAKMQVSLIAYGTVWPILLNTADGVRGMDAMVNDVARSYRVGWFDRIFRIVLRAASPQIVAGMRTALSIGVTVIIFSEMIGSTNGIGYQILQAQRNFAIVDMWGGIVFLGILGYLLNVAFRGFERWVLGWHRGMRALNR